MVRSTENTTFAKHERHRQHAGSPEIDLISVKQEYDTHEAAEKQSRSHNGNIRKQRDTDRQMEEKERYQSCTNIIRIRIHQTHVTSRSVNIKY